MKRFYATLALVGAVITGAFAQDRSVDWKVVVVSPAEGATVKLNSTVAADSTTISYMFINLGPDSVMAGDTILFSDNLSGDTPESLFLTNDTAVVRMGDTVGYSRGKIQLTSTDIPDGDGTWCGAAFIIDGTTGALMQDDDTTNNVDCNNIVWKNVPLAINDVNFTKASLNIFPNPASNQISFTNEFKATGTAVVKVTDIAGRTVKTINLGKQNAGTKTYNVDIAGLNNGMYYIELTTDDTRSISKFTKN